MFSEITTAMQARMAYLEEIDSRDRNDGTERMQRLRQIPPETGKFITLLAANCPEGQYLEIGTSAGYSTLWLSLAARQKGIKIRTHELLPEKIRLARETFALAGVTEWVELVEGDALVHLGNASQVAFCFLDCEKELYEPCWDILAPKIVPGGMLVADNAINHYPTLKPMIEKALADPRFDSLVVPIGKGELVCRRKQI